MNLKISGAQILLASFLNIEKSILINVKIRGAIFLLIPFFKY